MLLTEKRSSTTNWVNLIYASVLKIKFTILQIPLFYMLNTIFLYLSVVVFRNELKFLEKVEKMFAFHKGKEDLHTKKWRPRLPQLLCMSYCVLSNVLCKFIFLYDCAFCWSNKNIKKNMDNSNIRSTKKILNRRTFFRNLWQNWTIL